MKTIIMFIICMIFTGCSIPYTKQTINLKCENGFITFQWWKAGVLDVNTDIRHPNNLRQIGFYTDDNGKYMRCIEDNK